MEKFAELIDRYRWLILAGVVLVTAFFGFQLKNLTVKTDFEDLLPQHHPYIKVHNQIRKQYGGANQVLLMLQVRRGDIFNQETLSKVKYITERLRKTPGVARDKIRSIATRRAKYAEISSGKIGFEYLMFPGVPKNREEMDLLRHRVYSSPRYYGPYVSMDSKKTLITVDFYEERLDFEKIFYDLSQIRKEVEDDNHILNIAGEPMHLGFIKHHNADVIKVLGITVIAIILIAYACFRSLQGVVIPLVSGCVSAVWGLGIMAMMGYHLDPLILVLPFLISLMTARHGMQKMVRYTEEYLKLGDGRAAARNVITSMFAAGVTGIVTDSFGIALVALAAIPILQQISLVCVLWTIPTLIIALILTPLMLSMVPVSNNLVKQYELRQKGLLKPGLMERSLSRIGSWIVGNGKWVVIVIAVLVVTVSFFFARKIEVGDFIPGSSILWPDHRYNKDALRITYSMPLLNPLYIIMDTGGGQWSLENPDIIKSMDRFQRHVLRHRRVMFVQSIVNQLPALWSGIRDGDPNYYFLPHEPADLSYCLKGLLYRSRPGDWSKFVSHNISGANIIVYCRDKMPRTLRSVMKHIKEFIEKEHLEKGKYLLAGGTLGVQAAVREEIESAQMLNLSFALLGLFVFCSINFRSIVAGLILTIPLAISNVITFALMGAYQIGLTVSTYPISSIGIGLGVDYGIYLISRIQEERKTVPDINTAVVKAIINNGRAIVIIGATLTVGLMSWLTSALKFQAEMGALLAIVLFFNVLGALFLVPSFIAIFKPKFIEKTVCLSSHKSKK